VALPAQWTYPSANRLSGYPTTVHRPGCRGRGRVWHRLN